MFLTHSRELSVWVTCPAATWSFPAKFIDRIFLIDASVAVAGSHLRREMCSTSRALLHWLDMVGPLRPQRAGSLRWSGWTTITLQLLVTSISRAAMTTTCFGWPLLCLVAHQGRIVPAMMVFDASHVRVVKYLLDGWERPVVPKGSMAPSVWEKGLRMVKPALNVRDYTGWLIAMSTMVFAHPKYEPSIFHWQPTGVHGTRKVQ